MRLAALTAPLQGVLAVLAILTSSPVLFVLAVVASIPLLLAIGPAMVHVAFNPYLAPLDRRWWRIALWFLPGGITAYWLLHVRPAVVD